MEFGTSKKKVVWLCHFASEILTKELQVNKQEFAPWISSLVENYDEKFDIDLHVVIPNLFTNRSISFRREGITFWLYPFKPPLISRKTFQYFGFDYLMNFSISKYYVRKIVGNINPDLIHLHGAENPYYSSTILTLSKNYKILLTIQGFFAFSRSAKTLSIKSWRRASIERKVIESVKHIAIASNDKIEFLRKINPNAKYYCHQYPTKIPRTSNQTLKSYDISFFARVNRDKGIEDLINAIEIVRYKIPEVKMKIIGPCSKVYQDKLINMIEKLNLNQNIEFVGYIVSQQDAYNLVSESKINVLPTYNDMVPGTVVECMYMRIPVIAYATGGLPEFNKHKPCITLVDKGNIHNLAEVICSHLSDTADLSESVENAFNYVASVFDPMRIWEQFDKTYQEVMNLK